MNIKNLGVKYHCPHCDAVHTAIINVTVRDVDQPTEEYSITKVISYEIKPLLDLVLPGAMEDQAIEMAYASAKERTEDSDEKDG